MDVRYFVCCVFIYDHFFPWVGKVGVGWLGFWSIKPMKRFCFIFNKQKEIFPPLVFNPEFFFVHLKLETEEMRANYKSRLRDNHVITTYQGSR